MKKIIICLFILIGIVLVGILAKNTTIQEVNAGNNNFVYIDYQRIEDLKIYRFYDKNTKVIYMFIGDPLYSGGGLTIIVDEKGEPLLYQ